MLYTKELLIDEINKRKPWYQRIEFPEFGVTTTDDINNIWDSTAPDNRIGGLDARTASQLRPLPKWNNIEPMMPNVSGLNILEIGSNNGFFSFKFAEMGAKSVIGVDVNKQWLKKAQWAAGVLNLDNVRFEYLDFMLFGANEGQTGMLKNHKEIPIPYDAVDIVFSSTVINHMFFPFFAIYKMLCIAKKYVIIDFPVLPDTPENKSKLRLDIGDGYHAFVLSKELLINSLIRFGIKEKDIQVNMYNNNLAITLIVNTQNRVPLSGA